MNRIHTASMIAIAEIEKARGEANLFEARRQELELTGILYDAWDHAVELAVSALRHSWDNSFGRPNLEESMAILNKYLRSWTKSIDISPIEPAFARGKEHVQAMFKEQTGKDAQVKVDATFGLLFGLTEDHALEAMQSQLFLSAGGFWDDQMSESIKAVLAEWFDGGLTSELADRLEEVTKERLKITGSEKSLPRAYFEGLAEHSILRTRTVGTYYEAKRLGAVTYVLVNPRDHRTSPICRAIADGVTRYQVPEAGNTITAILQARSLDELKRTVPFLNDAEEAAKATGPVPPLHWRCRTWMKYQF